MIQVSSIINNNEIYMYPAAPIPGKGIFTIFKKLRIKKRSIIFEDTKKAIKIYFNFDKESMLLKMIIIKK